MSNLALACDFVDGIPWEKDPVLVSAGDSALAYVDALVHSGAPRMKADSMPVGGTRISFRDDIWDFRPYYENVNSQSYRAVFRGLPEEVVDHCKFFVLKALEERRKLPTVIRRLNDFKSILASVLRKSPGLPFCLITTDDIVDDVESRNRKPGSAEDLYTAAYVVYRFLIRDCGMALPINSDRLQRKRAEMAALAKASREASKTPDIPGEYLDAILSTVLRVMRDEGAEYNKRATACLLAIETQLALRPADLVALRVGQLHETSAKAGGRPARFIRYTAQKPSKAGERPAVFDIRSNALSTEAFETLARIRGGCPLARDSDFLYVLEPKSSSKDALPVSASRYRKEYHRLLAEELPELSSRSWEGATWSTTAVEIPGEPRRRPVRVCSPTSAQFRVRLCTELHERGYPQKWIDEFMGHLSGAMAGYYARPKDTFQENIRYTERVIEDIAGNGTRLLGGRFGDEVKAYIEDFIDRGGFDVRRDIREIVEGLGSSVVVRAKAGGACCVRTTIVPCSKDARTNELLCAYGLCPNLFHFYHAADATCADFAALRESHSAMLEDGRLREAEKELNKVKDLCRRRLLPELDELERELGLKGEAAIVAEHAGLAAVIASRADIREEAESWLRR